MSSHHQTWSKIFTTADASIRIVHFFSHTPVAASCKSSPRCRQNTTTSSATRSRPTTPTLRRPRCALTYEDLQGFVFMTFKIVNNRKQHTPYPACYVYYPPPVVVAYPTVCWTPYVSSAVPPNYLVLMASSKIDSLPVQQVTMPPVLIHPWSSSTVHTAGTDSSALHRCRRRNPRRALRT